MGLHKQVSLALLLGAACLQTGLAKVFEVTWDVPSNGLILPSVSTAKCGDIVRFKCPPHATHGVFRMTSFNGTCPESFDLPSAGVVLSAPAQGCDFSLVLGDEPDFFVTSQAGGACHKNLKMNVHSVCPQTSATSASSVLGMKGLSSGSSWAGGVQVGGTVPLRPSAGLNTISPLQGGSMGAISALEALHGQPGVSGLSSLGAPAGPGSLTQMSVTAQQLPTEIDMQGEEMDMEAGSVQNAAGMAALPLAAVLGAAVAAAALVL